MMKIPRNGTNEVEGLPWVPARPTLGSRFPPGLCQVPVNKWCSLGSRVFLGFPWVPIETQSVCPGFRQIWGSSLLDRITLQQDQNGIVLT